MMDPITKYAIDVLEDRQVAGRPERLACQRHLDDLSRSGQLGKRLAARVDAARVGTQPRPPVDPSFPWMFDAAQAVFVAVEWFGYLHHVKGPLAGQPIVLIPAHVFELGAIFGWVSKNRGIQRSDGRKTGARRFEKAFITEARKNSKTTRLAGTALYLMVGDMEISPDVYCAAVDRTQARVLYKSAEAMARKSVGVRTRLAIGKYAMTHKERGGEFTAFSGETKNKDAFSPSGAIIDEYHAHPTSDIYDLISSAWGQRLQALLTVITTAGMDTESPCHKEYDYCKLILDEPTLNDRYFVMIRELDDGDDEHDPANWIKANPLRASTPDSMAMLQSQHDEAFGSGNAAKVRTFRVKNLNKWVEGNEDTFMGDYMDLWDELATKTRDEFLDLVKGHPCLAGADLSKKYDLTADSFVFLLRDGRVAICAHGFLPDEAMKSHEKTDRIPYREWAEKGWLTVTPGAVTDYRWVQRHIEDQEELNSWHEHQLCYDPYNATQFANECKDDGHMMVEIQQQMRYLNEPTKTFKELVLARKLVHDGSPLLRAHVKNARQIVDTKENIMISKKHSKDVKRIDLLAATIDALRQLDELRRMDMSGFGF
jgi:phage terminase large subunit-like protein